MVYRAVACIIKPYTSEKLFIRKRQGVVSVFACKRAGLMDFNMICSLLRLLDEFVRT
jgi:hypothetical protein